MTRQLKNGSCSCWKTINKQLVEHNTRLSESFTFSGHTYLQIATEKIDSKVRKPTKLMLASYCPFCGSKLKDQK